MNNNGATTFTVDSLGDITYSGTLTHIAVLGRGATVRSFSAHSTQPSSPQHRRSEPESSDGVFVDWYRLRLLRLQCDERRFVDVDHGSHIVRALGARYHAELLTYAPKVR